MHRWSCSHLRNSIRRSSSQIGIPVFHLPLRWNEAYVFFGPYLLCLDFYLSYVSLFLMVLLYQISVYLSILFSKKFWDFCIFFNFDLIVCNYLNNCRRFPLTFQNLAFVVGLSLSFESIPPVPVFLYSCFSLLFRWRVLLFFCARDFNNPD